MKYLCYIAVIFIMVAGHAYADVIYFKNHHMVTTKEAWLEGDFVVFDLSGMLVKVHRDKVERIEKGSEYQNINSDAAKDFAGHPNIKGKILAELVKITDYNRIYRSEADGWHIILPKGWYMKKNEIMSMTSVLLIAPGMPFNANITFPDNSGGPFDWDETPDEMLAFKMKLNQVMYNDFEAMKKHSVVYSEIKGVAQSWTGIAKQTKKKVKGTEFIFPSNNRGLELSFVAEDNSDYKKYEDDVITMLHNITWIPAD